MRRFLLIMIGVCLRCIVCAGQLEAKLAELASGALQHERVYLHLDNTSYYHGDRIWFKVYLVGGDLDGKAAQSHTVYVELLTPGGEVIDTKVLKTSDGKAHGDFLLTRLPFYPGFYEVRAYTKYMLNFGEDEVFSRVIPIFDSPKTEGDFSSRKVRKYGTGLFTYKRRKPKAGRTLNVKFYPEGGNLVDGVRSRVAFEATDRTGHPVEVTGRIVEAHGGAEITAFKTMNAGKGVFTYMPRDVAVKAVVNYEGKTYSFNLPESLREGYVMDVDALGDEDSIMVTVSRGGQHAVRDTLGIALMSRGTLRNYVIVSGYFQEPVNVNFAADNLPAGVGSVVLFDRTGEIVAQRMIFRHDYGRINADCSFDKPHYGPHDPVELKITLTEADGRPFNGSFSLSVTNADDDIVWRRDVMTDLLLMSDLKGYVADPQYYFEADDTTRRAALDLLMMVQGWRRYDPTPSALNYEPERSGIEATGVVRDYRKRPRPGVELSALLVKMTPEGEEKPASNGLLTTDSFGRFSFVADVDGEWSLILAARENGKPKDYSIALDRKFSPEPRPYSFTDLELVTAEADPGSEVMPEPVMPADTVGKLINDVARIDGRVVKLPEIVVKEKKRTDEADRRRARLKSYAYYDVKSGLDDMRDEGAFIGDDIHQFLLNLNRDFYRVYDYYGEEWLEYKGRMPLFVVDYRPTWHRVEELGRYKHVRLEAIKGMYVSEDYSIIAKYADPRISPQDLPRAYGCAVFVETYPDDEAPADPGKGVRKTRIHGYSSPAEFYSPDYSMLLPEPDYRRTLYWAPDVTTDEEGRVVVRFYNGSQARSLKADMQGVSAGQFLTGETRSR